MISKTNTYLRLLFLCALWFGCGPASDKAIPAISDAVEIRLDKKSEGDLISFYLGGYVSEGDSLGSLVLEQDSRFWMQNPQKTGSSAYLMKLFDAAGPDGVLSWEEFEPVVHADYFEVRNAPTTVSELKEQYGEWGGPGWFQHELNGQMTSFRRRISIQKSAVLESLERMDSPSSPILYGPGTMIVGEHLDGGEIAETTVMLKRVDGFWDFFAYGGDGLLAPTIKKDPDPIRVPTQCVGCHFGDRMFEPERSFPLQARPGPGGERGIYVSESMKDHEIARTLMEHARRSDHVLGLYATLTLSGMKYRAKAGNTSKQENEILFKFGITPSSQ